MIKIIKLMMANIIKKTVYSKLSLQNKRKMSIYTVLLAILLLSISIDRVNASYNYEPYFTANGSNHISIPDDPSLRLTRFSIAAWFKTSMTSNTLVATIVNKGGFGSDGSSVADMNYGIWLTGSKQGVQGMIQAGFENANGADYFVTSSNRYNDDQWHYAVVTYDGNVLRLYIDGTLVASRSTNAIPDHNWNKPLTIGKDSNSNSRYFIGNIDEVRVYNRALSEQEVIDAYNGRFSNDGLVAYHDGLSYNVNHVTLLENQEYYFDILEALRQAERKIHLHVFQLEYSTDDSRPNMLLKELVNAKNRGVDVRVTFSSDSLNLASIEDFFNVNGIPYRLKGPHAKVVNIDDKVVYIGSANWRKSSLTSNNELSVKTYNISIISKVNDYLDSIWNTNGKYINYTDTDEQEVFITGGFYHAVKNAIENAKKEIRIIQKWWSSYTTDPNDLPSNLARAVVDAKKRGVDVRVILDDSSSESIKDYLESNGVLVKLDPKSGQSTHTKSVLVDNTVFVGSHNWTDGNINYVGDASLKVIDVNIRDDFMAYFETLWDASTRE